MTYALQDRTTTRRRSAIERLKSLKNPITLASAMDLFLTLDDRMAMQNAQSKINSLRWQLTQDDNATPFAPRLTPSARNGIAKEIERLEAKFDKIAIEIRARIELELLRAASDGLVSIKGRSGITLPFAAPLTSEELAGARLDPSPSGCAHLCDRRIFCDIHISADGPNVSIAPGKKRGRPAGAGSYAIDDAPLLQEMKDLLSAGAAKSTNAAAMMVEHKAKGATPESKATRLRKAFGEKFPNNFDP